MDILVKECEKIKNGYFIKVEPKDIFYVDGKGGQLGVQRKYWRSKCS